MSNPHDALAAKLEAEYMAQARRDRLYTLWFRATITALLLVCLLVHGGIQF